MSSKFLRLNRRDFIRGLIITVICAFITGTYQVIASGFEFNWITMKPVVIAAVGAGVSYLTKNLLTNSQGNFMSFEQNASPAGYGTKIL
jgi:hypothetical protein